MHQSENKPQQCVPDELHMLLRISEVLFCSFGYMIYLDKKTHRNIENELLQKRVKLVEVLVQLSMFGCVKTINQTLLLNLLLLIETRD